MRHGPPHVVLALLFAGADVAVRNEEGKTALQWAREDGHVESVLVIQEHARQIQEDRENAEAVTEDQKAALSLRREAERDERAKAAAKAATRELVRERVEAAQAAQAARPLAHAISVSHSLSLLFFSFF